MPANPFYVDPMGDFSGPLAGLSQSITQYKEQSRKEEEAQRMSEAKNAFKAANGDPDKIADLAFDYPEIGKQYMNSLGIEDDAKAKEANDFMRNVLASDPEDRMQIYKDRVGSLKQQGRNLEHSSESMMRYASNPDAEIRSMEMLYATTDPEGYKAYKAAPTLSSTQKKVSAEGIDPFSKAGQARAKEIHQGQRTDPSLRSDAQIIEKANDAQLQSAGYANRVKVANDDLKKLEATPSFDPASLTASMVGEGGAGNLILSEDQQLYNRAKSDFITSVLRKESGAAIGKDEFKREDKKYFPQVGDSKNVIERKAKARDNAFKNLSKQSKGVYDIQFGMPKGLPKGTADNGDGTYTLPDGRIVEPTK